MNTIASACVLIACLHITPASVVQGDPIMITLTGNTGTATAANIMVAIDSATAAGDRLYWMNYNGTPTAFYGTDINQKVGTTTVIINFKDGSRATTTFQITPRIKPEEALPIPQSLGGNSAANGVAILGILQKENADLASVYSRTDKALWTTAFAFPTASTTNNPRVVTDPYGYNRDSGSETITHKGVDFRAPPGTPVYAVNRGVVRVAKPYTIYGNTVIVDHGLGILSMYMHLTKSVVTPGQLVQKGQLVGYSGETGYAEGPHLHLTIRIDGISIDPTSFYNLFGVK